MEKRGLKMPLLYETPTVTSFMGWLAYLNTITGGLFWTMISVSLLIVFFVAFSVFKFKHAVLASVFLGFVFTVLLRIGGLVSDVLVGLYIIGLAFAGLYAKMNSDSTQ